MTKTGGLPRHGLVPADRLPDVARIIRDQGINMSQNDWEELFADELRSFLRRMLKKRYGVTGGDASRRLASINLRGTARDICGSVLRGLRKSEEGDNYLLSTAGRLCLLLSEEDGNIWVLKSPYAIDGRKAGDETMPAAGWLLVEDTPGVPCYCLPPPDMPVGLRDRAYLLTRAATCATIRP